MNSRDKTREELLKELQKLQQEYDSLKISYEKDISRHKLAEEKLRESELKYRNLLEQAPDTIFLVDPEANLLHVNLAGQKMLGYSEDELCKMKTIDTYPIDEMEDGYRRLRELRVMHSGETQHFERLMRRKDGTLFPVEIHVGTLEHGNTHAIIRDITERKLAEETYRKLTLRQEAILAAVPEIIMEVDKNKIYTWANRSGLQFFGEDVIGKEASFYFEGEQETYDKVQPIFEGIEDVYYVESWQRRYDGEKRLLAWWCRTLKDNEGNVTGALSSARDITERKQAEEALAQEQYLMNTLMDNLPDHIYFKDQASRFIRINKSMAQFVGLNDPDQAVGKTDFDFFTGEHAKQAYDDEQAIIRTGQLLSIEEKETHHDRPDTWVSTIKMPMRDNEENITGTFGISRDITARKRRELESQVLYEITQGITSTDKLDEFLKLIHDSISKVVYAENCFVALYNQSTGLFSFPYFVDKFDVVPPPTSMGKSCTSYVFHNNKPLLLTQEIFNDLYGKNEVELVGTPSPSWIGIPLQIHSRTIGVLVLQHYEKENIYTENDMKLLISIGSQIAVSIGHKKAEEEIKLKNELLQTINAEKDKLFSIIAHDLKSPLSAFLGATQILTEEIQNMSLEEIKEITVSMRESANSIYGLLENLLEWSRLKRGLMDFIPEKFNAKQKITACIEVLLESAQKKEITIDYSLQGDLTICADSHMFETVIRNMVSNAIKFTPKSGAISISATAVKDNNVEIKIRDTGIGMNRELINKLFLLNEKTNRKGTEGEPSSGLGLLLCKEFIEKHNGKIRVESEEGKGSTFSFIIPEVSKK